MKDHAPSAERNRHAILEVLQDVLPNQGLILEIAAGTGQHAVHFAPRFPGAAWQPTEKNPDRFPSIRAWSEQAGLPNLRPPLELDCESETWPVTAADAIVTINMLHISPWSTCLGWLKGAGRTLKPGAPLYYYGAFIRDDRETAPSNLEFDRSLKARDPAWGVRRLEDVVLHAESENLMLDRALDMPNNNYSLVLRKV